MGTLDEGTLSLVRAHMHSIRIPLHHDKVYKEECMFSFDSPESPGGLYINLSTFQGFGKDFVSIDYERSRNGLYLLEKWTQVPLTPEQQAEADAAHAAQLAAGAEGGLRLALGGPPRAQLDKKQWLVVMGPEGVQAEIPLPCPDLPERVLQAIAAVMAHESVSTTEAAAVWEEERRVSRYAADLPQLPADGKRISPNPQEWRCEETGATENLWLNLSTGFIGSGRRNWDGSGGNGSALRHYEATGRKYPLVVKLGTITPRGADVYSYAPDEDDMVLDPYLDKHLAHWGINMMQMEKSEKSMAELQMALNTSYEFSRITESGTALRAVSGPGLTGLINLGNSCYMNSVMQVLQLLPTFQQRYASAAPAIFYSTAANPADDLAVQLAKVGVALAQARTGHPASSTHMEADNTLESVPPAPGGDADAKTTAVRPQSFKSLVGRGHPEFSSARQQDALEFFGHLMELVSRCEHSAAGRLGVDPASTSLATAPSRAAFTFKIEDRVQCLETTAVRYKQHEEQWLALNIPLEAATNKELVEAYKEREARRARLRAEDATAYIGAEPTSDLKESGVVSSNETEQAVVPQVPFAACLASWSEDEIVADVWSAAAGARCPATKFSRFATFPPFLMIALKRYYTAENWVPRKLEVEVDVPERLSLEHLRSTGPQPGEQLQPEEDQGPGGAAGGQQPAGGWQQQGTSQVSIELLSQLTALGFGDEHATAALQACGLNVERAADWLFSHMDDLDSAVAAVQQQQAQGAAGGGAAAQPAAGGGGGGSKAVIDGPGEYELVGIISHMGANTGCGHYVAHVKKDGKWYIFNDEKVAESEKPPRDLGYVYMFQRTTSSA